MTKINVLTECIYCSRTAVQYACATCGERMCHKCYKLHRQTHSTNADLVHIFADRNRVALGDVISYSNFLAKGAADSAFINHLCDADASGRYEQLLNG